MRFTLFTVLLLGCAMLAFTGCTTATKALPTIDPAQVAAVAAQGTAIVDQLSAAGAIPPAKAATYKAQIAQYSAFAELAVNLYDLVANLQNQAAAANIKPAAPPIPLATATPTPVPTAGP